MDAWQEFNSGIFTVSPRRESRKSMAARINAYRIGNSVFGRYTHGDNIVRRRKPLSSSLSNEDLLVIRMYNRGRSTGAFGEQGTELTPSAVTLFNFNQEIEAITDDVDYVSFVVPHSSVGYDPSRHTGLFQIPSLSPSGRVLRSNIQMMMDLIPYASVKQANSLIHGMCGLLQGLITDDLKDESIRERFTQSREIAVRRYVIENLKNPALSAEAICKSIGVSRAVLYRMYEKDGGIRRAITRIRLEKAYEELAYSEPARGLITQVSKNWAFFDQAHFSRLFRRTFGCRARDVLGSALETTRHSRQQHDTCEAMSLADVKPLSVLYQQPLRSCA